MLKRSFFGRGLLYIAKIFGCKLHVLWNNYQLQASQLVDVEGRISQSIHQHVSTE